MKTYVSLSLRLLFAPRVAISSATVFVSSLLSSMARRICSSSSYAASRLFMVERRLMVSLRDLYLRLELSREESRDETAVDAGATGRYCEERCLRC